MPFWQTNRLHLNGKLRVKNIIKTSKGLYLIFVSNNSQHTDKKDIQQGNLLASPSNNFEIQRES